MPDISSTECHARSPRDRRSIRDAAAAADGRRKRKPITSIWSNNGAIATAKQQEPRTSFGDCSWLVESGSPPGKRFRLSFTSSHYFSVPLRRDESLSFSLRLRFAARQLAIGIGSQIHFLGLRQSQTKYGPPSKCSPTANGGHGEPEENIYVQYPLRLHYFALCALQIDSVNATALADRLPNRSRQQMEMIFDSFVR